MPDLVLESSQGMFAPIRVTQSSSARRMIIGEVVQGGVLLERGGTPGCVPLHPHVLGLALGLYPARDGHVLVLGLGAGELVSWLLAAYAGISITVVEIDPRVVALAERWFPVLRQSRDTGRLNTEIADAVTWVEAPGPQFDAAVVDINDGCNRPMVVADPVQFLKALRRRVARLWVNHLGYSRQKSAQTAIAQMIAAGFPVSHVINLAPHTMNTLLGSAEPFSIPGVESLVPGYARGRVLPSLHRLMQQWS